MEYSISKIIKQNQKYLFYAVVVFYLVLSSFFVAIFATGYTAYEDGIIWALIGAGLFSFWKMTNYEHDRFLYMFLTVGCFFIYFTFDLLPITVLGLLFFCLYFWEVSKDIKIWLKANKITL